jgi:predicted HTH transcriptional regulator
VDINNLGDGTTYLRNPSLVRLAYQIRLVETRGTGIRLIYESCQKAGLKKPTYHEEGDFVKLIIYFEPDPGFYDNQADSIIAFIKMHQSVTAQQVAHYLSSSHNTAIRKLAQLIKSNKVKTTGKGRSVRYCLN